MLFATSSYAVVYDFAPYLQDPHYYDGNFYDLDDLDHWYYYQWVIQWDIPPGEEIIAATLRIEDINDWTVEANDILFIHLLDFTASTPAGVTYGYDAQGGPAPGIRDNFHGQGILLTTYTDDDFWPNPSEDWSHPFTQAQIASLTSYASDGRFGFGFDPDCHYWNNGVSFQITTSKIPEPATLSLLGLGLVGFVLKFKKERR